MLRTTALTIACLGLTAPSALADAAALDRALALVPDDAISFVAVPNLKALSDDIAQLVEATGQGGLLSMGRPIDVLKAQLGVGANLDEKGSAVAYFPPAPAELALPVVVVPTTDGEAFLKANLTAAPDAGEGAFTTTNGQTVFARVLDGCVVLAPTKDTLPAAAPAARAAWRAQLRPRTARRRWLAGRPARPVRRSPTRAPWRWPWCRHPRRPRPGADSVAYACGTDPSEPGASDGPATGPTA